MVTFFPFPLCRRGRCLPSSESESRAVISSSFTEVDQVTGTVGRRRSSLACRRALAPVLWRSDMVISVNSFQAPKPRKPGIHDSLTSVVTARAAPTRPGPAHPTVRAPQPPRPAVNRSSCTHGPRPRLGCQLRPPGPPRPRARYYGPRIFFCGPASFYQGNLGASVRCHRWVIIKMRRGIFVISRASSISISNKTKRFAWKFRI